MKKAFLLGIVVFAGLGVGSVHAGVDFSHYVKSEWWNGYCYRFEIDNQSEDVLENWDVKFDLWSDIRSTYSANFVKNGDTYTAKGVSWNKNLKSGRDTRFGFCVDSLDTVENVTFSHVQPSENVIFENTFTENWVEDWVLQSNRRWGFENFSLLDGDILKVFYPAGSYKPSGEVRGGGWFIKRLDETGNDMYLSYDVKLEEGFDFVKGGKLPGFCGGECPTGGGLRGEGFSARFMWRADGELEVYAYLQDKEDGYGTSIGRGAGTITTGTWYNLTQRVKLNTSGNADGIIEFYVDGELVYSESGLNIVDEKDVVIDGILFSTFFGGSDESWATPINTYSYFKNFKVYTK